MNKYLLFFLLCLGIAAGCTQERGSTTTTSQVNEDGASVSTTSD